MQITHFGMMPPTQSGVKTPAAVSKPKDTVQFSGKRADKKKREEFEKFLKSTVTLPAVIEISFDDKKIEKQLRINEYLGITPKKYLNQQIDSAYKDIEKIEEMKAYHQENVLNVDEDLKNLPDFTQNGAQSTQDLFELSVEKLREGIEKLETLKKDRFGIEDRFSPESNVVSRFGQKHFGKTNKQTKTKAIGATGWIAGVSVASLLLGPLGTFGSAFLMSISEDKFNDKMLNERLEKAYLNEVDIALQEVIVNEMVHSRLPSGSVGVAKVIKRPDDFEDKSRVLVNVESDHLETSIRSKLYSDLAMLKRYISKNQVVEISIIQPSSASE